MSESQDSRTARVEIGRNPNGTPSIKVDGVELCNKIAADDPPPRLEWVPAPNMSDGGYWVLTVAFIEADVTVDVDARLGAL